MKNTKIIALLLIMSLLLSCALLLTGCKSELQYEVPNYQGLLKDGQTKSDFNQELFYRNDHKIDDSPDPLFLITPSVTDITIFTLPRVTFSAPVQRI